MEAPQSTRSADNAPQSIDRLLACRGVRHNTLGPTGSYLFCSHLDNALGLRGRFCFLQDDEQQFLPDPVRLEMAVNGQPLDARRASCMWYPSHARRQIKECGLGVVEAKFITADDVACDVVELSNCSEAPLKIRLSLTTGVSGDISRLSKDCLCGSTTLFDKRVQFLLAMPALWSAGSSGLICDLTLAPGKQTSVLIAFAVGLHQGAVQKALHCWARSQAPLLEHQLQWQKWFDRNCPTFDCPDDGLNRLWWYRWFVARRNLLRIGKRNVFQVAQEGRAGRLSVEHAADTLAEIRWLRDPALTHEQIRAYLSNHDDNGVYQDEWAGQCPENAPAARYPEGVPLAIWQALCVHPDADLLNETAASASSALASLRQRRDSDNNFLLSRSETDSMEGVTETALFAASLGVAGLALKASGNAVDAQWHLGLAEKFREHLVAAMWDEWDRFFHDRNPLSGEPDPTLRASALLPFALNLVPLAGQYHVALEAVVDETRLGARYPVRMESAGQVTLPAVNRKVAEALAQVLRSQPPGIVSRQTLLEFVLSHSHLMCEQGDWHHPLAREAYNSDTGQGWGAIDCFTGSLNDLIIHLLVGLVPREDEVLEIDPLVTGWSYFRADGLRYHGHDLSIIWESRLEDDRYAGVTPGLTVLVDGSVAAQSPQLERLTVSLPR